jgi:hypothetical protein
MASNWTDCFPGQGHLRGKLRKELKAALTRYVAEVRLELTCSICEDPDERIVWHHPNGDGHLGRVSDLVSAVATIEEIDAEIARCVPLCGSCHAREHGRMDLERYSGKRMTDRQKAKYHREMRDADAKQQRREAKMASQFAMREAERELN